MTVRRTLDLLLALAFALFAALQVNDPPPGNLAWMAVYAAGAVVGALTAFGRDVRKAALGLAVVVALWSAFLFVGVVAGGDSPLDLHLWDMERGGEEAREGLGLALVAAYLAWVARRTTPLAPLPAEKGGG